MKKNVLIVEDFDASRKLVINVLERKGFNVLSATNGVEAMKLIASGERIDLLITDYNMPEMNGEELIREFRSISQYKYSPIFVLSTETSREVQAKAMESNITAWIRKPFKFEEFITKVERVLR